MRGVPAHDDTIVLTRSAELCMVSLTLGNKFWLQHLINVKKNMSTILILQLTRSVTRVWYRTSRSSDLKIAAGLKNGTERYRTMIVSKRRAELKSGRCSDFYGTVPVHF